MPKTSKLAISRTALLASLSEPGFGDHLISTICASLGQHTKLPEGVCLVVARMVKDSMLKRLREGWSPPNVASKQA